MPGIDGVAEMAVRRSGLSGFGEGVDALAMQAGRAAVLQALDECARRRLAVTVPNVTPVDIVDRAAPGVARLAACIINEERGAPGATEGERLLAIRRITEAVEVRYDPATTDIITEPARDYP